MLEKYFVFLSSINTQQKAAETKMKEGDAQTQTQTPNTHIYIFMLNRHKKSTIQMVIVGLLILDIFFNTP